MRFQAQYQKDDDVFVAGDRLVSLVFSFTIIHMVERQVQLAAVTSPTAFPAHSPLGHAESPPDTP